MRYNFRTPMSKVLLVLRPSIAIWSFFWYDLSNNIFPFVWIFRWSVNVNFTFFWKVTLVRWRYFYPLLQQCKWIGIVLLCLEAIRIEQCCQLVAKVLCVECSTVYSFVQTLYGFPQKWTNEGLVIERLAIVAGLH